MLKKILSTFTLASVVIATNSFAQQIPNAGMENWMTQSGPPTYEDPTGWGTPNALSGAFLGNNPVSVFKAASPDINGGTYAMKIVTFKYTPGFVDITAYLPNDTLGFAFTGAIQPASPYLKQGYPETIRYAQFEFYAKYTAVGTDLGNCFVLFKKRNAGAVVNIAAGAVNINPSSTFTKYTITLAYANGGAPDTAVVVFNSSGGKPQIGSTLWVDDMAFTGVVAGIDEANPLMNTLKVYPNPATENITLSAKLKDQNFSLVEIFDVAGHKVDGVVVQNNQTVINTLGYAQGLYSYNAYDDKKVLIGIGKFNVVK